MGLLVTAVVVMLIYAARLLINERLSKRHAIPAAPRVARSAVREGYTTGAHRARRLGRPKTGADGDFHALIAARRFRDASRLALPNDHLARAQLAIAREAPDV